MAGVFRAGPTGLAGGSASVTVTLAEGVALTLGQAVRQGDLLDSVVQRADGAFAITRPVAPDRVVDTTAHVLESACGADVDRFAHPSTDKAADPVNVLGSTERIAERLTTEAGLLRRRALEYAVG